MVLVLMMSPFKRMVEDKENYNGYVFTQPLSNDAILRGSNDVITLKDNEFLPFGDNTAASLDGRYFGGVPYRSLVGPAFVIYWPFGERWGRAR